MTHTHVGRGLVVLLAVSVWIGCGSDPAADDTDMLAPPLTEEEVDAFLDGTVEEHPDGEPPAPANSAGEPDMCASRCAGVHATSCGYSLTLSGSDASDCHERCTSGCLNWYYGTGIAHGTVLRNCTLICRTAAASDSCVVQYCEPSNTSCNYIFQQFVSDPGYGGDGSECRERCRAGCRTWYGTTASWVERNCAQLCP